MSPELFSGWGVRTLAEGMGRYNPMSYHNGSVWPHDNALVVAGMTRYGFRAEAGTVALALVEAARSFGGRLPELFCGFPRARYPEPVPYPASCSPQAWASATPVQLLRSLLGAEPADDGSGLTLRPALPAPLGEVRLRNLPVGDRRVGLLARRDRAQLLLAPPGEARP
jgi:glycogen debranching enzyme